MSPQLAIEIQAAIQAEQEAGRQKYGKDADNLAHDDRTPDDAWHGYIADHNERASVSPPMERRQHLLKVAGLAVSAVEAFDRKRKSPPSRCCFGAIADNPAHHCQMPGTIVTGRLAWCGEHAPEAESAPLPPDSPASLQ